ncbi:MAG: hypothetical protein QM657_15075 [Lacrimispora sp.]|uniref:hypothetical protein n=1 Tax=Lacrimispora sp. TaxID=2719234 RepID=UPI0039E7236D
MEIDHIYICTEKNAPAGDLLVEFGLLEGSSNTHPGQGTANRRFYFHNLMLELLWVEDSEEVQNERTKPMRLFERCELEENANSPFGMAFRPTADKNEILPFQVWNYQPIYLPDFLKIQVADNTPLSEPMYFYLSFAKRQDSVSDENKEPMEHKVPLREITSIKIYVNQDIALSSAAVVLNKIQNIAVIKSQEHLLELEFDNGQSNQLRDFRPGLPLIFRW